MVKRTEAKATDVKKPSGDSGHYHKGLCEENAGDRQQRERRRQDGPLFISTKKKEMHYEKQRGRKSYNEKGDCCQIEVGYI